MPRYALLVEYDGFPFAGWQRQADQPSVQGALETAIARLDANAPGITGAGRTDAGVHALGQVTHVDLSKAWDPSRLAAAINAHLRPAPVAVIDAAPVLPDFHARFSAVRRDYRYIVVARRAPLAIQRGRAWRTPRYLDVEAMRLAAAHLIGHHDFTTFRSSMCQAKSPVKTLDQIDIETSESAAGQVTTFALSARSFLHNQVRSIVGTLERVGMGAWPPERVGAALKAQDRATCGPVAPPDGLFLVAVSYPESPFAT